MSRRLTRSLVAAALLVSIAGAAPALAQLSFQAEIDCGGRWSPGDTVPATVRFEEQAFTDHEIAVTVDISVPGRGSFDLFQGTLLLGPNQDVTFSRQIQLPQDAPLGSYDMSVTADDGSMVAFDTCSFDVR